MTIFKFLTKRKIFNRIKFLSWSEIRMKRSKQLINVRKFLRFLLWKKVRFITWHSNIRRIVFQSYIIAYVYESWCHRMRIHLSEAVKRSASANSVNRTTQRHHHCYLAKLRRIVSDLTRHSSFLRCSPKQNILANVSSFTVDLHI